jgi:hypothetical protein
MTLATVILTAVLTVAAAYDVAVVLVALGFRRRVRDARLTTIDDVGVSILIPLEGSEPGLADNLVAYCQLDYPGAVQIVVGSLEAQDPALATARLVATSSPARRVSVRTARRRCWRRSASARGTRSSLPSTVTCGCHATTSDGSCPRSIGVASDWSRASTVLRRAPRSPRRTRRCA